MMGLWFGKAFFWVDLFIFSLAEARRRRGGKFFEMGCGELDGVGFPKGRWLVDWGAWRGRDGMSRRYRVSLLNQIFCVPGGLCALARYTC